MLAGHGLASKGCVLFHPGSRWQFKCWPADKAAALLDDLDRRGERVVISAAPDARERELVADILARIHHARPIDLSGKLSLKRSEERRVGKEWSFRTSRHQEEDSG